MLGSRLSNGLTQWIARRFARGAATTKHPATRDPVCHVIIIDGTLSSLDPACIGNPGLTYRLLQEAGRDLSLYYAPGIQLTDWASLTDVIAGRGINRQIRAAYAWLASRYRPGDRIYLFGYSRGAYAVRSLAGIVDRVGLLRADAATERNVRDVYRHYQRAPDSVVAKAFAEAHCHQSVSIEMIGVWDTVKSLGINMPLLWRLSVPKHAFHSHQLAHSVKHGYHALARDETRVAYSPVLWDTRTDWDGHLVQMWFRGCHGDVGGQLSGFDAARPLSNIPLVWMLEQAEACGLPLPPAWQERFPCDPTAPSMGPFRGAGRWLLSRRARRVGTDASERVHSSVSEYREKVEKRGWWPRLMGRA